MQHRQIATSYDVRASPSLGSTTRRKKMELMEQYAMPSPRKEMQGSGRRRRRRRGRGRSKDGPLEIHAVSLDAWDFGGSSNEVNVEAEERDTVGELPRKQGRKAKGQAQAQSPFSPLKPAFQRRTSVVSSTAGASAWATAGSVASSSQNSHQHKAAAMMRRRRSVAGESPHGHRSVTNARGPGMNLLEELRKVGLVAESSSAANRSLRMLGGREASKVTPADMKRDLAEILAEQLIDNDEFDRVITVAEHERLLESRTHKVASLFQQKLTKHTLWVQESMEEMERMHKLKTSTLQEQFEVQIAQLEQDNKQLEERCADMQQALLEAYDTHSTTSGSQHRGSSSGSPRTPLQRRPSSSSSALQRNRSGSGSGSPASPRSPSPMAAGGTRRLQRRFSDYPVSTGAGAGSSSSNRETEEEMKELKREVDRLKRRVKQESKKRAEAEAAKASGQATSVKETRRYFDKVLAEKEAEIGELQQAVRDELSYSVGLLRKVRDHLSLSHAVDKVLVVVSEELVCPHCAQLMADGVKVLWPCGHSLCAQCTQFQEQRGAVVCAVCAGGHQERRAQDDVQLTSLARLVDEQSSTIVDHSDSAVALSNLARVDYFVKDMALTNAMAAQGRSSSVSHTDRRRHQEQQEEMQRDRDRLEVAGLRAGAGGASDVASVGSNSEVSEDDDGDEDGDSTGSVVRIVVDEHE